MAAMVVGYLVALVVGAEADMAAACLAVFGAGYLVVTAQVMAEVMVAATATNRAVAVLTATATETATATGQMIVDMITTQMRTKVRTRPRRKTFLIHPMTMQKIPAMGAGKATDVWFYRS